MIKMIMISSPPANVYIDVENPLFVDNFPNGKSGDFPHNSVSFQEGAWKQGIFRLQNCGIIMVI